MNKKLLLLFITTLCTHQVYSAGTFSEPAYDPTQEPLIVTALKQYVDQHFGTETGQALYEHFKQGNGWSRDLIGYLEEERINCTGQYPFIRNTFLKFWKVAIATPDPKKCKTAALFLRYEMR